MYANTRVGGVTDLHGRQDVSKGRFIFFSFFSIPFFLFVITFLFFSSVVKLIHLCSDILLSTKIQNKRLCPKSFAFDMSRRHHSTWFSLSLL